MKILSWNVNGIRAAIKKGFLSFLDKEDPDILCLQETKINKKSMPKEIESVRTRYFDYWSFAEKSGYSGTAILTKIKPIDVKYGIGIDKFDSEGRSVTLEFKDFFLISVYFPNSQRELARLDFKMEFDEEFLKYINKLRKSKPIIFAGDLNVAHNEIDLKNPKANEKNAGFYIDERKWFDRLLENGYVDTFRIFNKEPENYTWWTYRFKAREKNIGWRIDYFIASKEISKRIKDSFILKDIYGSDHCPIGIILKE